MCVSVCISCLHGISCSDTHLEHHCFEHSSLSPSLFQIPTHQMDFVTKITKFGKMIVLG